MAGLTDISVSNFMKVEIKPVSGGSFTEIQDIQSWSGFQEETSQIEVKTYNQKYARKLAGSASVSAIEMTMTFNPASEGYKALAKARADETKHTFKVTYFQDATKTNGSTREFNGIVTSYSESSEYDSQRTCTWSIAVDGALGELQDVAGG